MARSKHKEYVAFCPDCKKRVVVVNPRRVKGRTEPHFIL